MGTQIGTYWTTWRERRRERRWNQLLQKHCAIENGGMCLKAKALKIYCGRPFFRDARIAQIRLQIKFLDDRQLVVLAKSLTRTDATHLEGKQVRFKFLPGDLSQIVIIS